MIRKSLVTLVLTAGMVAGTAGIASAHECFVANRSDRGNAAATHSDNWHAVSLSELFSSVHFFVGEDVQLTDGQVATAVDLATEQGVPASFTVFGKHMLPRSVEETEQMTAKPTDGKGIDHFVAAYGDQLIGIHFSLAFPSEA